jgi:hypothetical protein
MNVTETQEADIAEIYCLVNALSEEKAVHMLHLIDRQSLATLF